MKGHDLEFIFCNTPSLRRLNPFVQVFYSNEKQLNAKSALYKARVLIPLFRSFILIGY